MSQWQISDHKVDRAVEANGLEEAIRDWGNGAARRAMVGRASHRRNGGPTGKTPRKEKVKAGQDSMQETAHSLEQAWEMARRRWSARGKRRRQKMEHAQETAQTEDGARARNDKDGRRSTHRKRRRLKAEGAGETAHSLEHVQETTHCLEHAPETA